MINYYCRCGKATPFAHPTIADLLKLIREGKKLQCKHCKEQIPANVSKSKFARDNVQGQRL
jgi:hypothetical protein